ncbi:hypothetical protein SK128_027432 [Halocaridina rubra]|uniref:Uncharacterized protein n=1 Tax=Halocaridina rubra TaxID=373956 RepID=A0AAN8X424_HALRR
MNLNDQIFIRKSLGERELERGKVQGSGALSMGEEAVEPQEQMRAGKPELQSIEEIWNIFSYLHLPLPKCPAASTKTDYIRFRLTVVDPPYDCNSKAATTNPCPLRDTRP